MFEIFITNALAPAKLKAFEIDEANKRVKIIVSEDQLSLAIGKRGQNARLTSKLTGWQVDIEAEVVVTKGFEEKVAEAVESIGGHSWDYARTGGCAGASWLDSTGRFVAGRCERFVRHSANRRAGGTGILEAARAEAARRTLKVGETPVNS